MANRAVKVLSAAALLACCSLAVGVETHGPLPAATQSLLQKYPGAHAYQENGRIQALYGMPMTAGKTADAAAAAFIAQHGDAFGAGTLQVALDWAGPLHGPDQPNRFTVFSYNQYINGVPVEFGMLKLLVLNGETPRVVYAGGTLAPTPEGGFGQPKIDGATALAIVQATPGTAGMTVWGNTELVIWQGNGDWVAPVLTWKVTGESVGVSDKECKTFFVNAITGVMTSVRDEVQFDDVGGTISGKATPGLLPDITTPVNNAPTVQNMMEIKAGITGGATLFTDRNGLFNFTNVTGSPVTVSTGTGAASGFGGRWVQVVPVGVAALTANSGAVTPPTSTANIQFNTAPVATNTAQVNTFLVTNKIHDYFRDRAPAFTGIDFAIRSNTGVAGTCNAFFTAGATPPSSSSINFYNAGGGCVNTAYSTVNAHEYGHNIVNRLGRAQGSFGEGYGDTVASMLYDTQATGHGFNAGTTTPLRDPIASNIQYPCSQEIHTCGMVEAGVWWRICLNMGTLLGSQPGLTATQQLQVSWSLMTVGGSGNNALFPQSAVEVLTVDDNDGNINNGTPHYAQICPAFAAHNIQCPAITQQPCYANCDGSTAAPILNVNDFSCFLNKFAAGDTYANCDNSTIPPILNVNDFTCFTNKFALGCP